MLYLLILWRVTVSSLVVTMCVVRWLEATRLRRSGLKRTWSGDSFSKMSVEDSSRDLPLFLGFSLVLVRFSTVGVGMVWDLLRGWWSCTNHRASNKLSALRAGKLFWTKLKWWLTTVIVYVWICSFLMPLSIYKVSIWQVGNHGRVVSLNLFEGLFIFPL